jgi:hypothetical protein
MRWLVFRPCFEWALGPRNPMKNSMPEVGYALACQPVAGPVVVFRPCRRRKPQISLLPLDDLPREPIGCRLGLRCFWTGGTYG